MDKQNRMKEIIRELASQYFLRESNHKSLITVTNVEIYSRGGSAKILVTVLPEDQEHAALDFMGRKLGDFREFVQKNSRIARVPFFSVEADAGEKNRQRIDELGNKI